ARTRPLRRRRAYPARARRRAPQLPGRGTALLGHHGRGHRHPPGQRRPRPVRGRPARQRPGRGPDPGQPAMVPGLSVPRRPADGGCGHVGLRRHRLRGGRGRGLRPVAGGGGVVRPAPDRGRPVPRAAGLGPAAVFDRMFRWVDHRLGASKFARSALNKIFPDNWSFMLGEVALYCLVVLILTGIYLTFFFSPSARTVVYDGSYAPLRGLEMSEAYRSTVRLSFDVRAGLVFRQMHHWAALIFVAAVIVHLLRIFFTGAFRKPRELNWIIGVTLL